MGIGSAVADGAAVWSGVLVGGTLGEGLGLGEGATASEGGMNAGCEGLAWMRPVGDVQALRRNRDMMSRLNVVDLFDIRVIFYLRLHSRLQGDFLLPCWRATEPCL